MTREKWKLERTAQCKTCPWVVGNTVANIPNYEKEKHRNLESTIATDAHFSPGPLKVMACHHSTDGSEHHCLGWLMNQLGPGNNIPLRLGMSGCENAGEIKLAGKQKADFRETFE